MTNPAWQSRCQGRPGVHQGVVSGGVGAVVASGAAAGAALPSDTTEASAATTCAAAPAAASMVGTGRRGRACRRPRAGGRARTSQSIIQATVVWSRSK